MAALPRIPFRLLLKMSTTASQSVRKESRISVIIRGAVWIGLDTKVGIHCISMHAVGMIGLGTNIQGVGIHCIGAYGVGIHDVGIHAIVIGPRNVSGYGCEV